VGITTRNDLQRTPRYIVVEGPIGAGKTSLARRLAASFSGEVILEQVEENPFLERFYRSGRTAALPAQLFFLFHRTRLIEELRQSDLFATVRVADFHLDKDRIFAELNLDPEELDLYDKISSKLDIEQPAPDLVVYLQASVDALLGRIAQRGIPYERSIDRRYLERLTEAYSRYFHHYDQGPLLIVNASSIDPIHSEADYDALLHQVLTTRGRSFFNPSPETTLA
jgi:deoxyadenosine/deoxycytidine kinase